MINVLYVTFASTNFDGATYSLMDLIRSVREYIHPLVLVRTRGCVYDFFKKNGCECVVCDFEENLIGKPVKPHQYLKQALTYVPHYWRYKNKNHKCIEYIYHLLRDRDIKIVHVNNTVMSVGFDIAHALHAKCVWHLRGFMDLDFGWMPLTGWKTYRKVLMHTDAVIGITPTVLNHFIDSSNSNTFAIFDAVRSKDDIRFIYPKEKYFLFCAGLLSERKGCDFAIKAFVKSGLATQGFKLKIIGECNAKYAKYLDKIIRDSQISDSIELLGRQDDVESYMSKAIAFLMCSENEGLGRVSVEAMFNGCLVIGRNSGGTKDFIIDNTTGLLFDTLDECVEAMLRSVKSDNRSIIFNAQKYAQNNFSIENYGKKILAVYGKVLNKNLVSN